MSAYDPFAPIYDDWSAHMTEDVAFYVELARETEGPLVELAVGNGRVAIPVARETGRPVLGIDSSPAMLAQARERAAAAGVDARAARGRHARARAGRAGRPDLRPRPLARPPADVGRPPPRLRARLRVAPPRRPLRLELLRLRPADRGGATTASGSSRTASATGSTTSSTTTGIDITLESGDAISLWWLNRSEWEGLIDVAGFEVEALYGGFDRSPFDENANEFVWVVRKPV